MSGEGHPHRLPIWKPNWLSRQCARRRRNARGCPGSRRARSDRHLVRRARNPRRPDPHRERHFQARRSHRHRSESCRRGELSRRCALPTRMREVRRGITSVSPRINPRALSPRAPSASRIGGVTRGRDAGAGARRRPPAPAPTTHYCWIWKPNWTALPVMASPSASSPMSVWVKPRESFAK